MSDILDLKRTIAEIESAITDGETMMADARAQGIPPEHLAEHEVKFSGWRDLLEKMKVVVATLEAEHAAAVSGVWSAHEDCMATVASLQFDADEQRARGNDAMANMTETFATMLKGIAQQQTRTIVEQ